MRLFSLSNSRLQNFIEHTKKGEISVISNIGKNPNSNVHKIKYQEKTRNSIILHVMQFSREESHYTRNKNNTKFLRPDFNISRLHSAYKIQNPDSNVSIQFYYRTYTVKIQTLFLVTRLRYRDGRFNRIKNSTYFYFFKF